MPENGKLKRPTSHRWAIAILGFVTAGFAIFLIDLFTGRSGVSPKQYWSLLAILSVGALAFLSLVFGGSRRWAYYVSAVSLGIWVARSLYTLSIYVYHFTVGGGGPVSKPYFHLAERDKTFVIQEDMPLSRQFMLVVIVGLWVWLFIRFTFGRPSRSYYGLPDREKSDVG